MNAIIAISGMIPEEIAFEMLGRAVDDLKEAKLLEDQEKIEEAQKAVESMCALVLTKATVREMGGEIVLSQKMEQQDKMRQIFNIDEESGGN